MNGHYGKLADHTIFKTPEAMWERFCEYAADVLANPLQEERVFSGKNGVIKTNVNKLRPLTLMGFRLFAPFTRQAWEKWRKERPDLWEVMNDIEDAVYSQKFEAASAGLMNAGIIGKSLGLADKIEVNDNRAASAPQVDRSMIADKIHPDCDDDDLEIIYAAGLKPPLYSTQQIADGMPYTRPAQLIEGTTTGAADEG